MFERWTERARTIVMLAQEEARELGHGYIGTEHLLLGLLREEDGIAGRVLASLGVEIETARDMIDGRGEPHTTQQIPFTPRCKKVCELSLREALALGNNYIGTEHVLLGLVRENEGVAARILRDLNIDSETVRNEVIRVMTGPRTAPAPPAKNAAYWESLAQQMAKERDDRYAQLRRAEEERDAAMRAVQEARRVLQVGGSGRDIWNALYVDARPEAAAFEGSEQR